MKQKKPPQPKKDSSESGLPHLQPMISAAKYIANAVEGASSLRKRFGENWVFDSPLINPVQIIEEAKERPMYAAQMCQFACTLLKEGHHARTHEYMMAAYAVACNLRGNERQIRELAFEVIDARSPRGVVFEKVRDNLLHYLFIFIFFQSGLTTRNRATHYAESLQIYFDDGEELSHVSSSLDKHGQERLRGAATRVRLTREALEWTKEGKPIGAATMNEVLAKMADEDPKVKAPETQVEPTDYGPRGLPPSEPNPDGVEVGTDWEDSERARDDTADDGDEADHDEDEVGQPPEVDEFFENAMRLSAQLVAGLNEDNIDDVKRKMLTAIVMQLWTEILAFRALVE